ncbi:BCL2-associated athanogene-like protein [Handroanthus impetiginosus]|uniref:BCL2-associated athanogene-like protein n=1 Tax=Handroanthus impetiginosus TaxID=429701 RepID=A0A2G9HH92_9LAMI|nr:BCL2-associated athanogene-like protein [Handroanthus impetiginosus]
MMRMSTKNDLLPPQLNGGGGEGGAGRGNKKDWELRPGGMLVQNRTDTNQTSIPPPIIRVRVKYGSIYHEIRISSKATFGELKKMLSGPTGLHHQDQKLFYKDKEKDSKAFLDTSGVKDKSKLVLQEDPISQERRFLEMRKNAKMEKAAKTILGISLDVDKLAGQVSALESVVSNGGKVIEKDVANLIELLMNHLVRLDGIVVDGDVELKRKTQVKRVQKYVETLDIMKLKISTSTSSGHISSPLQQHKNPNGGVSSTAPQQHSLIDSPKPQQEQQKLSHSTSGAPVVITTQWETFDSTPAPVLGLPSTSTMPTSTIHPVQPSYTWDLL